MIIVIDNYDSFTYNLVQFLGCLGQQIEVFRNNKITIRELEKFAPNHIVISPGPGRPEDAGISIDVVRHFSGKIPILGVCLGHQSIGQAFGGNIILAPNLMHGKFSQVFHNESKIFKNIANPFQGGRYHSLVIDNKTLPDVLEITAQTEDEIIMAVQHESHPTIGVQFHPESILTDNGMLLLENFLYL